MTLLISGDLPDPHVYSAPCAVMARGHPPLDSGGHGSDRRAAPRPTAAPRRSTRCARARRRGREERVLFPPAREKATATRCSAWKCPLSPRYPWPRKSPLPPRSTAGCTERAIRLVLAARSRDRWRSASRWELSRPPPPTARRLPWPWQWVVRPERPPPVELP